MYGIAAKSTWSWACFVFARRRNICNTREYLWVKNKLH